MFTWAFYLAIGFAFLDWASTWKGWKLRLYIAKPATLIFLILWTIQVTHWQGMMLWFGIALVFSLLGDILLMLNPRYFMGGLAAFLIAHISYLVGFNQSPVQLSLGVTMVSVLVGIAAARAFRLLRPGILRAPHGKRFLTAAIAYGLSLTLMMLSALLTLFRAEWATLPALLVSLGAILFFISDILLAFDRFARKIKHGQSFVHLTYHMGQLGLITGAVMHILK